MTEEISLEEGCGEFGCSSLSLVWVVKFGSCSFSCSSNLELVVVLLSEEEVCLVAGLVVVWTFFFKWVCQTFFISLSVRPGNFAAIADHL